MTATNAHAGSDGIARFLAKVGGVSTSATLPGDGRTW